MRRPIAPPHPSPAEAQIERDIAIAKFFSTATRVLEMCIPHIKEALEAPKKVGR